MKKCNYKREKYYLQRPGTGISPIYIDKVLGKAIKKSLKEDHILKWNDLK